ncbi:putative ribonuclease H-like domain-containing protein [Tanacetum coccineum]|uniref:Ribonuclease H-like domain-containing protein n=1 Tax=Tanacetum coccineum TaxID=301880 RepID=A0ABQ4ZYA1_9ASTR
MSLKKAKWGMEAKDDYQIMCTNIMALTWLKKFLRQSPPQTPRSCYRIHTVVDSGCSSHMTSNKAYLSDYKDFNGGFVAFGSDPKGDELKFNLFSVSQMCDKKNSVLFTETECLILSPSFKLLDESQVVLRAPRKDDVYSLDLKNIVPSGGITCLYANATADESKLWHRRLGHVNFKNINKLVKGHLVRGLPSKVFVNDHTCVACKKGKQHKASCKAKLERIIRKPLELLHMDLFGPVSVESINKKRYCLVVTDDFSRFSWVFFLATKDETSEILCKFIIGLENQLNHNVKIIRCDNGTEFKNHAMNEFCAKKGIKREFSVARTPQQNGVAERKNRTLIEAARTMLADSLLPIPFWAEAVNTACYVLNRVLVTKPQNKTPYELLIGNSPSISFMRPFGCPLTILNTLDSLGKFDGKSDEGYLLGYSTTSKAFRVYNKRTKRVEENLHIDFLKDQPNVAGTGPNWMFDLDFLTNSMNYIPVSVENQFNMDAGTQDSYVAGSSEKDKEPTQEYILLPLHPHRTKIPVEDVALAAHEKPSESSSKNNDGQYSEDVANKEGQHQMNKRAAQATSINKLSTGKSSVSTATTPYVSTASPPTCAYAGESSFIYLGGKIPIDASTILNADLPIDLNMPDLEDDSDAFSNNGIFNGAYDDENVGAVADFNNMDDSINETSNKGWGCGIPAWMITDEMKLTEHYKMQCARLTPPVLVPSAKKANEMILQDMIQKLVEDPENVDDSSPPRHDDTSIPGTRLEPRCDKESPEVEIVQEKEEETTKDRRTLALCMAQISLEIQNAIDNAIPSLFDASVRGYMSGHILHVHPAQVQSSSVPEQQHQLYLLMKADPLLQTTKT